MIFDQPEINSLESKLAQFKHLIKNSRTERLKRYLSFAVIALVAISSLFLARRIINPVDPAKNSSASTVAVPWVYPRKMKVLIMRYFDPASTNPTYKDPVIAQQITDNLQTNINEASRYHGNPTAVSALQVQVVGQYDFGAAPNLNDDWEATYNQMLTTTLPGDTRNACDIINSAGVDEVWFLGDPTVPNFIRGPEYAISSKFVQPGDVPTDFEYSVLPKQQFCGGKHSFMVFFVDLSRPAPSIHAFAHYIESLIGTVQTFDLVFKKYMGITYDNVSNGLAIPGVSVSEACGNIHVPPNVPAVPGTNPSFYKYERANYSYTNTVSSSCPNWKPDGTGQKVNISSATWINNPTTMAGDPEFKFHMWWLQNLPNISNGLTYLNLPIPNWWDFVSDTDNTIAWYLDSPYFMNPELFTRYTSSNTTSCSSTGGTVSTCSVTGSTLGVKTENNNVLAATTYGNLALVSVLYSGRPTNTTVNVSSITYCGEAMTRAGTAPINTAYMKTEIWYKILPKAGECPVVTTFNSNPLQNIVTATIFSNIDTVTPIANVTSSFVKSDITLNPGSITMSSTGPKNSLMVCAYDMYSEQSNPPSGNKATATTGTVQLWKFEKYQIGTAFADVWGGIGAGTQRTVDGRLDTLFWNTVKTQPWSATCVNLNVKPAGLTVQPTPGPTTVDLKVSSTDGPITIPYNGSVTLSWTSSLATSCTASGAWTGAKTVTGSELISGILTSGIYTLTCSGVTDSVSVVVATPTPTPTATVNLKINGSDGPVFIQYPNKAVLSWSYTGTGSCVATGAYNWVGTKATNGTESLDPMSGIYTLKCGTSSDSVQVAYALPAGTSNSCNTYGIKVVQ